MQYFAGKARRAAQRSLLATARRGRNAHCPDVANPMVYFAGKARRAAQQHRNGRPARIVRGLCA
jgi:hypothetical protein